LLYAVQRLPQRRSDADRLTAIETELESLEGELTRVTAILANGASFDALLAAIALRIA
jgi:hypothetical protein